LCLVAFPYQSGMDFSAGVVAAVNRNRIHRSEKGHSRMNSDESKMREAV